MTKERSFEPNYHAALGLKQGHAITAMPFGSLLDVQNMNLDAQGGKSTRGGYTKLFSLPIQQEVRTLFDYKRTTGEKKVLAYAHDSIYEWDELSALATLIVGSLTTDAPWQFAQFNDRVLGVNGVASFDYNGTTYTKIGITAPTGNVVQTLDIGSGSLAVGTFSYVVTFYDSARGAESNSQATATATVTTTAGANLSITLSNLPTKTTGEDVTDYRIYRKAPGETTFTLYDTIGYDPSSTYTDSIGANASGTIVAPADTGQEDAGYTPPPASKVILEAFDRIFMVSEDDPTLLIYSIAGKTWAFPSGNFFPIGRKDGQRIDRIEKNGESVIIHKRNGMFILDNDPTLATPRRVTDIGTQDRATSVADVNDLIFRITPKGIYKNSSTDFNPNDLRSGYIGGDICDEEAAINWSNTDLITAFHYRQGKSSHVYFIIPNVADISSKFLVYDLVLEQWLIYYVGTDIYSIANWEDDGESKTMFGDGYGIVWEWNNGNSDGIDLESDELNGTATSATSNTLSDSTQGWTVNQFVGMTVTTRAGTGANQRMRVASNTSTQLTFTTSWATTPTSSTEYSICAIDSYADEFWNNNERAELWKRMRWILPYVRQTGNFSIQVSMRKDFRSGFDNTQDLDLSVDSSVSSWGSMVWGTDSWGSQTSNLHRMRFSGKYHYYSLRYRNKKAAEPFIWDGHGVTKQYLYDRNK